MRILLYRQKRELAACQALLTPSKSDPESGVEFDGSPVF